MWRPWWYMWRRWSIKSGLMAIGKFWRQRASGILWAVVQIFWIQTMGFGWWGTIQYIELHKCNRFIQLEQSTSRQWGKYPQRRTGTTLASKACKLMELFLFPLNCFYCIHKWQPQKAKCVSCWIFGGFFCVWISNPVPQSQNSVSIACVHPQSCIWIPCACFTVKERLYCIDKIHFLKHLQDTLWICFCLCVFVR